MDEIKIYVYNPGKYSVTTSKCSYDCDYSILEKLIQSLLLDNVVEEIIIKIRKDPLSRRDAEKITCGW